MSLSYHIYSDARLLLVVGDGTITQPQRIETVLACLEDPGYANCAYALWDVTRAESIPRIEDLRELIAFIHEHWRAVGPRKLAIVTAKPITFGLARTFEELVSASTLALEVRVFADREEAWDWLRGRGPHQMVTNRRYRILVVDDEDAVVQFVDRVVRGAGYATATARNAEAAIKITVNDPPFDLLLTDLMMPGICGDELARYLRRDYPDLKVLYLTGFADRLFADRAVLWQNESFVEKPVTSAALREAVSLALFGHTRGPE